MKRHIKGWFRSSRNRLIFAVFIMSMIYYIYGRNTIIIAEDPDLILRSIENRLREALREDKGAGCDMPLFDPFSKEATQFDKVAPVITCDDKDWVKCYLSRCKVVDSILLTTKNIICDYQDIIYQNDDKYFLDVPVKVEGDNIYRLIKSDHVKIKCSGTRYERISVPEMNEDEGEALVVKNYEWEGIAVGFREKEAPIPPKGRKNTLNVLMLGFDSTSKNGFIRRMPKSFKVLKEEFSAAILNGYNILGDGTQAALIPILTGETEYEVPECRKSMKNSSHVDAMPFIFYKLRDDGYRTAFFEDMPWIGTFQRRFRGFRKQPTDHYLRDFLLEVSSDGSRWWNSMYLDEFCVGDTPTFKIMFNITEQFFKLDGKKFCFTLIADISHEDFNIISNADNELVNFLRAFKADGRLENTLLIVMGDHGSRYSKFRDTFQAKVEERLPLMAIMLPERLKANRPNAQKALEANIDTLTTPHDIYATILDVLDMKQHWNDYKVPGADLPRGMTLLEPIPRYRSCSEAGIELHWCACVKWSSVPNADPIHNRTALALVEQINKYSAFMRSKCLLRTLTSIEWVLKQKSNKRLLSYQDGYLGKFENSQENYQIKIVVGPGKAVYEASMVYLKKEDTFQIYLRDISRINRYGNEAYCFMALSNGSQWMAMTRYYSSQSDDSPILSYRYRGYHHARWEPSTSKHRRRRSTLTEQKCFLFCAAMILFCVLLYIPVYNMGIFQIPERAVPGWTINTNRDTKIYVQPNKITTKLQPKDICNQYQSSMQKLFLIIVVCSSPKNFDQRRTIRDTWGNIEVYKKSYKIFTKIKEKYKTLGVIYGYTSAINNNTGSNISKEINERNDKVDDVTGTDEHNDINYSKRSSVYRTKRDISGLNKLLPKLAKELKKNHKVIKTENNIEKQDKIFEDDEEPMVPQFNMNKEIGEDENEETGNYDYENNIMKILPKGDENTKGLSKIMNLLKKTKTLEYGRNSLEEIEVGENVEPEFKILFILGLPHENDTDTQGKIEEETLKYGDIIQEDFIDSYYNLTLKSIMMLKWITHRCKDTVRYILKADDDVYVNVPNLILDLKNRSRVFDKLVESKGTSQGPEYLLIGTLYCGHKPILNARDKWYSPRYMYGARLYPRHLSGGVGYVMSAATAGVLYRAALATSIFHMEDIFITGICPIRAHPPQVPRDDPLFKLRLTEGLCFAHSYVTSHNYDQWEMRAAADSLLNDEFVDRCEQMWLTKRVSSERWKPETGVDEMVDAPRSTGKTTT